MLPYSKWMEEAIELLESSTELTDKRTAAWGRLMRIEEETATYFGLDDASTKLELTDSRLNVIVKGFEKRSEDWMKKVKGEVLNRMTVFQTLPATLETNISKVQCY
jgi:hypothetical protein